MSMPDRFNRFLRLVILISAMVLTIITIVDGVSNIVNSISIFQFSSFRLLVMTVLFWSLYTTDKLFSDEVKSGSSILILLIGFVLYPVYANSIDPSDFIVTVVSLLVVTIIPYTVYNPVKDILLIWTWNVLIFTSAIVGVYFSIRKISWLEGYADFMNIFIDEPFIPFAFLGAFVFINYIIYRYQLSNYRLNKQIEETNQSLENEIEVKTLQYKEIRKQNAMLYELQNDLIKLNEHLEEEVERRTRKINDLTRTLLKYGFLNSHLLRAPVSRMQSVLIAWELISKEDANHIIVDSVNELNQVMELVRSLMAQSELKEADIEKLLIGHYQKINSQ